MSVRFNDPAYLKRELERIATHPECPKAVYNIAADALQWARKHEPAIEVRPSEAVPKGEVWLTDGVNGVRVKVATESERPDE